MKMMGFWINLKGGKQSISSKDTYINKMDRYRDRMKVCKHVAAERGGEIVEQRE